jgi:hypothetical protein
MSTSTQPIAPLLPLPDNWRRIKDIVALYAVPLDKYGRPLIGAAPVWTLFPRWARELYRELAELSAKKGGNLWPSYEYIGTQLMKVTAERARQQVRALENWGFIEKRHRTTRHGWFDTNHYGLVNPVEPGNVIAIACRTYNRNEPIRVVKLSQQQEAPVFGSVRRADPRPQPEPRPLVAAPAVILPGNFRQVAESEGLIDPRQQHEAWRRYQDRLTDRSQKKVKKRGAFFRGICRNMVQAMQDVAAEAGDDPQAAVDVPQQQMAKVASMADEERKRRRQFVVLQAYRHLMAGTDLGQAAANIFHMPDMHRHCRLSECPLTEVLDLVRQAYEQLQPTGA